MSVVTYNGVCLPYVYTSRFDQTPMYDDVGDTDWFCTKIDLQCSCVLNMEYIGMIAPDLELLVDNTTDLMRGIRTRLLEPRRTLSVKMDGQELIPVTSNPGSVDAQNGPKPQSCIIVQLTNTTFFVNYHVIGYYWETNLDNEPGVPNVIRSPILYNRWTESVDIDVRGFSTWTRDGKFRIRSDNIDGFTVDSFRDVMIPLRVPFGFLRQSSKYTVDPSGLALAYAVTDREVYKMPPMPAIEANGTYTESTPTRGGAKKYGEVQLRLRGPKTNAGNQTQSDLITTAMGVCARKLSLAAGAGNAGLNFGPKAKGGNAVLEHCSVAINMYDNEVSVIQRVMFTNYTNRVVGFNILNEFGPFTPGSDDGNGNIINWNTRGFAGILLKAAAYYDPNLQKFQTVNRLNNELNPGTIPGQAGRFPETRG